jgi:DNA-binding transcriptional ArsR family regulator
MSDRVGATLIALADPTRRGIIEALAHGQFSAGELAASLGVTAAVLTRHLRVLREGQLVTAALDPNDQRRHIYELLPDPVIEIRDWADDLAGFWQEQLASFAAHAEENRPGHAPR